MKTEKNNKVLLAMSGGIDSSIAAYLLQQKGYEIVGITLKTWDYAQNCSGNKETGCCNIDAANDARAVAVSLSIPHYVLDVQKEFEEHIVQNFIDEYMHGRTPNPCVLCNIFIKWGYLQKKADQLGCYYIATGHYTNIREENNRFILSKGIDDNKDQSYVLWGLTQENLSRTLFPLGALNKSKIREIALELGFDYLYNKSESYEICFIPDNDYRNFLMQRCGNTLEQLKDGYFKDTDGKILGKHKGFPFYTIGQRKGLEIAMGVPMYVNKIDAENNIVVLGNREDLLSDTVKIININLIKYAQLPADKEFLVKVRYKDVGTMAKATHDNDAITFTFEKAVSAVTPGQSAVFYEGDDVVGGGIIC